MSLNATPSSERLHIGFFGLRNAGKSSLVNAVTGQRLSLVSPVLGTTTDPVQKAMELLPLGPVVIIDTPGVDDVGELGEMRAERARQTLSRTDIAVLVVDSTRGMQSADSELCGIFKEKKIPYIIAFNKCDLISQEKSTAENEIYVSAEKGKNIFELKELIGRISGTKQSEKRLVADLISKEDIVVLVTPIDAAAPKGRLILPQQQTIRDILDCGAVSVVTKETELSMTLSVLARKPSMVITDSQAFGKVSRLVPEDIRLTSFSILFARFKGELETVVSGADALNRLKDGDTLLISEGCTHHRQCGDIGTQKLPDWIRKYSGAELNFEFTSGGDFPEDLKKYALVVHCGGCMLGEREMKSRLALASAQGVPMTNYGTAIAQIHGILKRSLSPFPDIARRL